MEYAHHTVRLVLMMTLAATAPATIAGPSAVVDVRDHGAVGDGRTLDTTAINEAVEACGAAGGGQVRFAPGTYLSGTVHLRSHVTLFLDAGATLVGTTELSRYQHPRPPDFLPEARWGKWHRALILGDGLEDIGIAGEGVIDGNKVFDPTGEERRRGPHTFVFMDCCDVAVRDVSFRDSANYAIFFQISDRVDIRNVEFVGGWDGVHFRGGPERPCRDVNVVNCRFYTGDDSIAGRYWENVLISDCTINSSCNGIRLIGPATHLTIRDCLFYGPGLRPHRTSNRTNMLAGINLQPGAWDATRGRLDAVVISDVTMRNVATPLHFMLKPGNTAGRITVDRVTATGLYRAACSVESWAETAFSNVVFRDVSLEFDGGQADREAREPVKAPGVDPRALPSWGFFARNVWSLSFENVRFSCVNDDRRPVMICDDVGWLTCEGVAFPRSTGAPELLLFDNVDYVQLRQDDMEVVRPRYTVLGVEATGQTGRLVAGRPFSAVVTVKNGARPGLGQIELTVAEDKTTNWVWLRPNERKEVVFAGLAVSVPGRYEIAAGNLRQIVPFDRE